MLVRGLGLAGLLALVACGGGESSTPPAPPAEAPAAAPAPTPAPEAAAPAAEPVGGTEVAAGGAAACEVPSGELKGDCAVGAEQYGFICSTCHGPNGKGDGPAAAGLDPKPRDHTDTAYMKTLDDAHLYTVIKCGGIAVGKSPLMAAWGTALTDEQMRGLVCHLRKISGS